MNILCIILFFLFGHLSYGSDLVLAVGESKRFPHASSIWVENGKILKIEDNGHDLLLNALHPGSSLVRFGDKNIKFTVLSIRQANTLQAIENSVHQSLNLKMTITEGEVRIQGRIQRWQDWKNLANSCQKKNCQYSFQAKMDPEVFADAEKQILKSLAHEALPKLKIEVGENYFVKVSDKAPYLKFLSTALSAYGIEVIADQSSIEVAPLIKVQITVAEVKHDFMRKYGLKWPTAYTAQVLPNTALPELNQEELRDSAMSAHALETTGAGRVLASPNIICRSGKEAEFLAGGEFPIKILNMKLQEVVWKKYGVMMKVKPVADYNGRMSISIETEISSIDPSRTVDGIPALFTNRIQSHFDLSRPRTIALSGLIKSEESKNSDGLPWISRTPIFGALFSSKEFRENKSELVIFVRPEIQDPEATDDEQKLPTSVL